MEAAQIAWGNQCFFEIAVVKAMREDEFFAYTVCNSLEADRPVPYLIAMGEEISGRIDVDGTSIKNRIGYIRAANWKAILRQVSDDISSAMEKKDLNTDVSIVVDPFRFHFRIEQYERNREHDYEKVDDPGELTDLEVPGRIVVLKITAV
jgi:hypothetical protein